jgi:hypothetical protein
MIPPIVVLKSKSDIHMEDWYRSTSIPDNTLVGTSETAYIKDELALNWIEHFNRFSKPQGTYQILLFDGHESHKA